MCDSSQEQQLRLSGSYHKQLRHATCFIDQREVLWLDYLDKETLALGLNEMNTEAYFSGTADYRVKAVFSNKSGEIDNEKRYVGAYDITLSCYDRPHITVTKDGNLTKRYFNKTMAEIMQYTITLTNDGSRSLGPITIRDIFPPGTEHISSSIRPATPMPRPTGL